MLGDGEVQGHAQAIALLQQHLHGGQGCLNGRQLVHHVGLVHVQLLGHGPVPEVDLVDHGLGVADLAGVDLQAHKAVLAVGGLINGSQGPGADGADLGEHLGCHVGGGGAGILALDLLHQGSVLLGEVLLIALDLAGVAGAPAGAAAQGVIQAGGVVMAPDGVQLALAVQVAHLAHGAVGDGFDLLAGSLDGLAAAKALGKGQQILGGGHAGVVVHQFCQGPIGQGRAQINGDLHGGLHIGVLILKIIGNQGLQFFLQREDAVMEAADRVREQDRTALQGCILTHDEFSFSNMVLY